MVGLDFTVASRILLAGRFSQNIWPSEFKVV